MKLILVIDDNRILPELGSVAYARTSADAIAQLQSHAWDEVWFDHDLKGHDTGMAVVKWIERQPRHPKIKRCYVHSMNGYSAAQMVKALSRFYPTHRMPLPKSMAIHEQIIEQERESVQRAAKLGHLMVWDHALHMKMLKDQHQHLNSSMRCMTCGATMTSYIGRTVADDKLKKRCGYV